MHLHPQLQQLFQAPREITKDNPILSGACLICQSHLALSPFGHLECIFNRYHCWVPRTGETLFLQPVGEIPFQVTINYRTQRTFIGLLKRGWHGEEALLILEEALPLDEATEDNLRTLMLFS